MLADATPKATMSRLLAFLVLGLPSVSIALVWLLNGSVLSAVMLPIAAYLVYVVACDLWLVFKAQRDEAKGYVSRRFYTPLLLVASALSAYQIWWFFSSAN